MAKRLDHNKLNRTIAARRPEATTPLRVWRAKRMLEQADAIIRDGEQPKPIDRRSLSTSPKAYRKFGGNYRLVMECWLRQHGVPVKGCELKFGALERLIRRHPDCPAEIAAIEPQTSKKARRQRIAATLRPLLAH